jgi:hypothetical protein
MGASSFSVSLLISQLRKQGWECALNAAATEWTAAPPDKSRKTVLFPNHPKDPSRVLRDLRHQGFSWPPTSNGHADDRAHVTATPFAPKPHPEVKLLDARKADEPAPPPTPAAITPPPVAPEPVDHEAVDGALAFVSLREAKEYERLAAADLVQCNRELDAVRKRVDIAKRAYDEALRALQDARATFDRAFGPETT